MTTRGELKYALMTHGVQCAIMDGNLLMLLLCVINWDIPILDVSALH